MDLDDMVPLKHCNSSLQLGALEVSKLMQEFPHVICILVLFCVQ